MEIDRDKENRDQRRKHIQSAIDWLERADSSIAEEQDIKGDLNLMLAKAELQHEKENRKSSAVFSIAKEFLTRAGTFAVAGIIAAVIFYYPKADRNFEAVGSEIENSVAVDAAKNEQPQPVEKPEKIIVEPVIIAPDTGAQVDSKQQIQDLVTSAGMVLRSK